MKFKVDIDCTPDEARAFFGLPDVKPLQEALLPEVEQRLKTMLKSMDPEAMLKAWLPDPQRVRAAAANVFCEHAGRKRQEEIALSDTPRTARLLLRQWRDDDVAAFAELSADPAVMRYLVPFADRAAVDAWVAAARKHWRDHGFG